MGITSDGSSVCLEYPVASLAWSVYFARFAYHLLCIRYRDYIWLHVRECNVIICSTEMRLV